MGHFRITSMHNGKIIFLAFFLISFSCNDTIENKKHSEQIGKVNFEKLIDEESGQTKNIEGSIVIEIMANDLNYNKYELENAKQDYYKLTDFQGYYSEIVTPIIDSLQIQRSRLCIIDTQLNFRNKNGTIYTVDIKKIQSKQGLILFNGKSEPVFWKGDNSGELGPFVMEFFK